MLHLRPTYTLTHLLNQQDGLTAHVRVAPCKGSPGGLCRVTGGWRDETLPVRVRTQTGRSRNGANPKPRKRPF
jgi:hypothetical protein